jgi:hypothetical protein
VQPPEMMVAWWDETRVRRPDDDGGIWVILGALCIKGKEKDLWARNCGMACCTYRFPQNFEAVDLTQSPPLLFSEI